MLIIQTIRNHFAHLLSFIQKNVFWMLLIIGFVVYGNGLFNHFVLDDTGQILGNPLIRSILNIPALFGGSTFSDGASILRGNYYRPLMTGTYTILYSLFGPTPFSFHLVQLLLHIINAWLVYKIFRKWLIPNLALFGSLIFLVHPINSETVLYIANLQDVLFMFFGLIAFYIFVANPFKRNNYFLVFVTLLFSLLSKETGILFICLLLLYQLFYRRTHLLRIFLISVLTLVIYFFLKYCVAHVGLTTEPFAPISRLPLNGRLIFMPSLIIFYLKTFLFPISLLTVQNWLISSVSMDNFYYPLLLCLVIFVFLAIPPLTLFKNDKSKKKTYIFFYLWFLLGLSLHLQIFPLDATVADHWFYPPIVGLIAVILLTIEPVILGRKFLVNFVLFFAIAVLMFFSVRSFTRAFDFRNEYTLAVHDLKSEPDNFALQNALGLALQDKGDLVGAEKHFLIASYAYPQNNMAWNNLGFLYEQKGSENRNNIEDYKKADTFYVRAIQAGDSPISYVNLAELRLFKERSDYSSINTLIESALAKFPNNPKLLLMHAITLYKLQDKGKALIEIRHALQVQPENFQSRQVLQWIATDSPINLVP
jgi:protein O-mannosyl-transferase